MQDVRQNKMRTLNCFKLVENAFAKFIYGITIFLFPRVLGPKYLVPYLLNQFTKYEDFLRGIVRKGVPLHPFFKTPTL